MLGVERKSLVLTEEEKRLTAYHEAGHAVVALKTPGSDPVHKVTIIPRGRALGLTASLPETDRHNYTRDWLIGSLAMFFGGRAAEEIVFGKGAVTTGAGNDIERATTLARRMVTQFGMSDVIGLMAVGEREQEVFLGREFASRREVSERTAQMVDAEVKRLLDEAFATALKALTDHRDLLNRIANALLERETIDREDLDLLVRNLPLPPRSLPPTGTPLAAPAARPEQSGLRPPILGAPPAEPAGA
jgi:cell division protease FtsH